MGLIRAAVGAVGGTLSDSWLDYIRAENMTPTTILTKGEQVGKQHRRGSADIISNGSRIEVGANQMMFLTEGGRIVDYTAEQGYYEVFMSQSPSLFNGELKASVKETFERFKFGGQPGNLSVPISSISRKSVAFVSVLEMPCNISTTSIMQNCSCVVTVPIRLKSPTR